MRTALNRTFGYSHATIYPDVEGVSKVLLSADTTGSKWSDYLSEMSTNLV